MLLKMNTFTNPQLTINASLNDFWHRNEDEFIVSCGEIVSGVTTILIVNGCSACANN